MPHSSYHWVFVMWISLAVAAFIPFMIAAAFRSGGRSLAAVCECVPRVGRVIALWWCVAFALSWSGALMLQREALRPWLLLAILTPVALGVVWIRRSAAAKDIVHAIPLSWLIGAQAYRGLGSMFLILYGQHLLPAEFANAAGWGDVTIGLLAMPLALYCLEERAGFRLLAGTWCVLGIADLVMAVFLGFLSSPSPVQQFAHDHPNVLMDRFPMSMIPTFLVPISVLLHVAALLKLRRS